MNIPILLLIFLLPYSMPMRFNPTTAHGLKECGIKRESLICDIDGIVSKETIQVVTEWIHAPQPEDSRACEHKHVGVFVQIDRNMSDTQTEFIAQSALKEWSLGCPLRIVFVITMMSRHRVLCKGFVSSDADYQIFSGHLKNTCNGVRKVPRIDNAVGTIYEKHSDFIDFIESYQQELEQQRQTASSIFSFGEFHALVERAYKKQEEYKQYCIEKLNDAYVNNCIQCLMLFVAIMTVSLFYHYKLRKWIRLYNAAEAHKAFLKKPSKEAFKHVLLTSLDTDTAKPVIGKIQKIVPINVDVKTLEDTLNGEINKAKVHDQIKSSVDKFAKSFNI